MAAEMSGEQIQAKITAARREAEGLKDKIRRRKEELGDTTRTLLSFHFFILFFSFSLLLSLRLANLSICSPTSCTKPNGYPSSYHDETPTYP